MGKARLSSFQVKLILLGFLSALSNVAASSLRKRISLHLECYEAAV
jgi:hypothetical protein